MSSIRRTLSSTTARLAWGGLALAFGLGLVLSYLLAEGSVGNAESDAEARAVDAVNTTLFDSLTPETLERKIGGEQSREVLTDVQAGILVEPETTRVRIWNPGGRLVFSSDPSDEVGEVVIEQNPQIGAALAGQTVSIPTGETVPFQGGLAGTTEQLFVTYVPLRLAGAPGVSGVVEVSQRYAAIETAASEMWSTVRLVLIVAIGVAVFMLLVSLIVRPSKKRAAARSEQESPGAAEERPVERSPRAEAELRRALDRAEQAETELRVANERLASAQAEQAFTPDPDRHTVELEQRAVAAEKRAAAAEAALQAAQRVAAVGSPVAGPARGVPGPGGGAVPAGSEEIRAKLRSVEEERDALSGEVARLRTAVAERDAALAEQEATRAAPSEGLAAAAAEVDKLRGLLAEQERRVADHEELAADAVRRALDAEERAAALEGAAPAAEATEELEGRLAEVEAARAQVEGRLAEAEAARAQAEGRLAEAEAARTAADAGGAWVVAAGSSNASPGPNGDGDQAGELQARIAELEELRRSEVAELQRAHEALANTQFEVTQARRRAKELEERLRELEADGVRPGDPGTPAGERSDSPAVSSEGSVAWLDEARETRQSEPEPEAAPEPEPGSEPEPEAAPEPEPGSEPEAEPQTEEEGVSLRERLSRAAAARHRAPGASERT